MTENKDEHEDQASKAGEQKATDVFWIVKFALSFLATFEVIHLFNFLSHEGYIAW